MSLLKMRRECTVTHDAVKSSLFHRGSSCFVNFKLVFIKDQFVWLSNIVANVELYFKLKEYILPHVETENCLSRKNTLPFAVSR